MAAKNKNRLILEGTNTYILLQIYPQSYMYCWSIMDTPFYSIYCSIIKVIFEINLSQLSVIKICIFYLDIQIGVFV